MRISAAIQHIRHLAVQGFPPRMAVAAMVDALDMLVPTRTKIFFWVDERSAPRDFYERQPLMDALDAYFSQSERMAADPEEPSFDKLANSPVDYGGWKRFERFANWDRSVLKNEVFLAYGIGNNIDFTLRDGGRTVAVLAIAREPGSAAYARREVDAILALRRHFVHAMNAPAALDRAADVQYEGVVTALVGADGTIVSANDAAEQMMLQLCPAQGALRMRRPRAPRPVHDAARLLLAANAGQAVPPPVVDVANDWGRFRICAHSLAPDGTGLVTIEKFVPRRLAWERRAIALDLSPRERTLAVQLCGESDSRAIMRDSGLTSASYREYTRRIYRRLGVDGRVGLRAIFDRAT